MANYISQTKGACLSSSPNVYNDELIGLTTELSLPIREYITAELSLVVTDGLPSRRQVWSRKIC